MFTSALFYPPNFSPWARATSLRARRSPPFLIHSRHSQEKISKFRTCQAAPYSVREMTCSALGAKVAEGANVRRPEPRCLCQRVEDNAFHHYTPKMDRLRRCQAGQTRRGGLEPMPESMRANYRPDRTPLPFAKGEDKGEGLFFCRSSSANQIARNTLSSSWRS